MRQVKRIHKHIGFDMLARRVEHEYKKKGYSLAKAREIGLETAGKVKAEIAKHTHKK